jgi:hypothetical protein
MRISAKAEEYPMNIPNHYSVLNDAEVLRDLYAQNFHNDPLLEHVCQRWELLVEGNADLELELDQERMAREAAETDRDLLRDELEDLKRGAKS